jgi:hypothetical protein
MNDSITERQRKAYKEAFLKYGATPMGTFQNNKETQYLRFERLIKNVVEDLHGSSIHDVGSGICDFHKFLLEKKTDHTYSGSEIVGEMTDHSLRQYPEIKLFHGDFLQIENEYYDFIFLSGTLNLKLNIDVAEWHDWALEIVAKMFKHATKAVSFNCLTANNTFSEKDLMYFVPQEIFDFCLKNLSRFVVLDNCYPLYEFTVTVFRPEYIKEKYDHESFSKYLSA